jgi:ABC-2 type transport system ATP-binding protein
MLSIATLTYSQWVMAAGVAVIKFDGLSKTYGSFVAVRDLAFSVQRGTVFGFLGPNGVGYLPDAPIFYDFLRGREILQFVGEMHGQSRGAASSNAARLLEELALADAAEEYAINYSMGMKKKLGLACALIHDPPVLILDEPTNGLDPRAAHEVQDRLRRSTAEGKTIFLSTHLLDMAERLCSRVGIIHQGELVAEGALDSLRSRIVPGGSLEEVFLKVTQPEDTTTAGLATTGGAA